MFGDELKKMLRLGMEGGTKEKGSIAITAAWRIADGAFYMGEGGLLASTS